MLITFSKAPKHEMHTNHVLDVVANLYRIGFLADESNVWAKTGDFEPRIWALTDKSSMVHYLRVMKPGCVRLTKGRVRWAPTVDASNDNPHLDVSLDELGIVGSERFTLVVDYCETSEDSNVTIIESSTRQEYENGDYDNGSGIRIIDAHNYRSRNMMWRDPDTGEPGFVKTENGISFYERSDTARGLDYEEAHSLVAGIDYLGEELTKKNKEILKKHMEGYALNLSHSDMQNIVDETYNRVSSISRSIHSAIDTQLTEREIEH